MFSVLRGACPACANFRIKQRTLVLCYGLSTQSVKNITKLPVERFKFKISRHDILAEARIRNREFHTTKRRDIPPLLALFLRPALRIGSLVFGRALKKWWMKKDAREREQYAAWFRKRKLYFYGIFGAICSVLLTYYLTHIENTPVTNRPRFMMFTSKQQAAFAKLAFEVYLEENKDYIVPNTHPTYSQLLAVINRLINANKDLEFMKTQQWTLTVIDLPDRNAFVLPGGNIFIFTGILKMVENNDQLSFIIAHEMSHALLKHSMERISNGFIIEVLLTAPLIIVWAMFPDLVAGLFQLAGQLIFSILHELPYSRALETEADEVGLTLAAKACVDVREAVVFWGLMRELINLDAGPEEIQWLSTHPNHKDREMKLDEQMSKAIALRSNYQCPPLNTIDPRKKFYERSAKEIEARFKQRGIV